MSKNGVIDIERLFEPPFTDQHDQGLVGVFRTPAEAAKIVGVVRRINENAAVG